MKRLLILFLCLFTTNSFASGIASNSASAPCTNTTLETYSGNSNLAADWQPNTINLSWYNEDEKLTVQQSAQSCVYDGTLSIPATQPTRTGYTFAGWKVRIPGTYTELEYIESTGTQYIDTGIIGNQNTKVDIDFQVTGTSEDEFFPFGSRIDFHTRAFAIWAKSGFIRSAFRVGFDGTNGYEGPNVAVGKRYHVVHSKDGTYVNNNKVWTASGWSNFTTPGTLLFFATDDRTSEAVRYAKIKVFYLKLYENNSLLIDLIPVRRNSDNVLGMYDIVTQTFFTNQGTGTFVAGPAVQ